MGIAIGRRPSRGSARELVCARGSWLPLRDEFLRLSHVQGVGQHALSGTQLFGCLGQSKDRLGVADTEAALADALLHFGRQL